MSGFFNPLRPRGGEGYAEALMRIRTWTRAVIPEGDPVISVTELACAEPGCPPRETVILVMWSGEPAWKLRVHKAVIDVTDDDVRIALSTKIDIQPRAGRHV